MSLRRRDDWDEALDEAYLRALERGEVAGPSRVVYNDVRQYGRTVTVTRAELLGIAGSPQDKRRSPE